MTRAEYLATGVGIDHAHRDYYAQFETAGVRLRVMREFDVEDLVACVKAGDRSFSRTPLALWDIVSATNQGAVHVLMKSRGDSWSLAGGVCVAKEVGLQIAEAAIEVARRRGAETSDAS